MTAEGAWFKLPHMGSIWVSQLDIDMAAAIRERMEQRYIYTVKADGGTPQPLPPLPPGPPTPPQPEPKPIIVVRPDPVPTEPSPQ
jgi:hypothetical protein